jgi:hypothetical protein
MQVSEVACGSREADSKKWEGTDNLILKSEEWELGMVVHTCNLSTQEAKAGLLVQDQHGLHSKTLTQNDR